MALFQQYTQPGVYTTVVVEEAGISIFGDARIPVLIGEGLETRQFKNIELHRGSSAVADDRRVHENLSDQITGFGREFTLSCHPVVKGDGKGTITNDPKDITVFADGIPILVSNLNGETGKFLTQQIPPVGTDLRVDYYFKRQDTLITNEDISSQVPTYATYALQTGLNISLSMPGASGNKVTLAFTKATTVANAKSDALAVSGVGSNNISIEISKVVLVAGTPTVATRTIAEIKNLIEAGIPTLSGGFLTATLAQGADPSALAVEVLPDVNVPAKLFFKNGSGPNTNKTFKLANVPVVDGTNGGVVSTNPKHITVTVNAKKVDVYSLDGSHGLFTLAQAVPAGSVVKVTYYTNRFQDTWDDLPSENVSDILMVGFAPDRSDFINTVDYVLFNNQIHWGAAAVTEVGQFTAGYTPFDASVTPITLVDEFVYLRPVTGLINGSNTVFELEDVPVTGSQLSHVSDDPDDIKVYAGSTPAQALANGPLRVVRLNGASRTFTLYNPPMPGVQLFASYYRNTLNDHTYTLKVVTAGISGQGSYSITDENGNAAPNVTWDAAATHVTEADFTTTGIVWPHSFSDLKGVPGQSPDEIITLTFQDDNLHQITTPSVQAFNETSQVGLRFTATAAGVVANGTRVKFVGGTNTADNAAVTVSSETMTVQISKDDGSTRTLQDIINLFAAGAGFSTTNAGRITCTAVGTPDLGALAMASTSANELLSGGSDAVLLSYSTRFKVSSNRTSADANQDGLGRTGNATTDPVAVPAFQADTEGTNGYLGQTYIDADTGVTFTIVDPNTALDYGYTSLPSPGYHYRPGDKIVFKTSTTTAFKTGKVPQIAVPGLRLQVNTTYGMFPTDTMLVHTFNKAGAEPKVGEFYYVSYETRKTEADFGVKLFANVGDVYAEYGEPIPTNRLSLAAKLMVQNSGGGTVFACVQVPKELGMEIASDQTFMDAIASMAKPLPGSERKVDVIVPLTTSPVVQQFLAKHLNTEASPRKRGEAIGFLGMGFTAEAADARKMARALGSERVVLLYPGGAILSADIGNKSTEFAVDGSFLAAAMCGMYVNPTVDVATTLTRQTMVGFDRLVRRTEDPILDLMAADGVCILTENEGSFKVRHYISTRMDNPITREITCTTTTDYVRQRTRKVLDQFVGRKNLQNVLNDIAIVQHSLLKSLIEQEIIEAYKGLEVLKDESDPTVVHVKVSFKPVFSLLWIDVTFRVTTRA